MTTKMAAMTLTCTDISNNFFTQKGVGAILKVVKQIQVTERFHAIFELKFAQ